MRDRRQMNEAATGIERMFAGTGYEMRAEQSVARALRRLLRARPYFYVINGLLLRRGDIDHIIIGPTGVFVVETKGYTGNVSMLGGGLTVSGLAPDIDPVRQARQAAATVGRLLRMRGVIVRKVQPVVCVPYARMERPQCTDGVLVTRREHLGYLVRHWQGQQLNGEQSAHAFSVLRSPAERVAA